LIRLEAVSRVYGSGASASVALDRVSLTVGEGEFVAVAGPSGSGKTTLLNIIGALDTPTSGSVRISQRELAGLDGNSLADLRLERIGFVFQSFNLIPVLSAAENVQFPLLFRRGLTKRERRERARRSLERVGLAGKEDRRPSELSGGERQRVAVARALAGQPAIVLADEPTANLDHETGAGVIALMRELNREQGTTFLYATHDPELIRLASRVITLRDGRLVEGDSPRAGPA
jgi:putative ABC transport system ATP-binding protein